METVASKHYLHNTLVLWFIELSSTSLILEQTSHFAPPRYEIFFKTTTCLGRIKINSPPDYITNHILNFNNIASTFSLKLLLLEVNYLVVVVVQLDRLINLEG